MPKTLVTSRPIRKFVHLTLLLPVLFTCSCVQVAPRPSTSLPALLSGELLFGQTIDVSDITSEPILAVDPAMAGWVAQKTAEYPHARLRLRKLIEGMIDDGLLTLQYDQDLTLTAQETFHSGKGNCLSFSNLFVALARKAELKVTFQMVDIPPSFTSDGEMVLLNNHINVVIERVRNDTQFFQDYVVDFNNAEYKGNYRTRKVSDDYVYALYHSNIAVEAIKREDYLTAFRHLKKGINHNDKISGLWTNLGVLYGRFGLHDLAEDVFLQSLALNPSHKSTLVNLARTLSLVGRTKEAEHYKERIVFYQQRNPYYHQHLALEALANQNQREAHRQINKAIALKADEHQFFFARAKIYMGNKDYARAGVALEQALALAHDGQMTKLYNTKLAALQGGGIQ